MWISNLSKLLQLAPQNTSMVSWQSEQYNGQIFLSAFEGTKSFPCEAYVVKAIAAPLVQSHKICSHRIVLLWGCPFFLNGSEALDPSSRCPSHFSKEKGTSLEIGFLVQPEKYGVHLVESPDHTMDFCENKIKTQRIWFVLSLNLCYSSCQSSWFILIHVCIKMWWIKIVTVTCKLFFLSELAYSICQYWRQSLVLFRSLLNSNLQAFFWLNLCINCFPSFTHKYEELYCLRWGSNYLNATTWADNYGWPIRNIQFLCWTLLRPFYERKFIGLEKWQWQLKKSIKMWFQGSIDVWWKSLIWF